MPDVMPSIESLPQFLTDDNGNYYYLNLGRTLYGQWSAGYLYYGPYGDRLLGSLYINYAADLDEVALRMTAKLERYHKRVS